MGWGMDEDVEYDELEEGLASGAWTERDGSTIYPHQMSDRHLKNAARHGRRKAYAANFTHDADNFRAWEDVFEQEFMSRAMSDKPSPNAKKQKATPQRGATVDMVCHCGRLYRARTADLNRGWAKSCSKSCAAIRRKHRKPAAKKA